MARVVPGIHICLDNLSVARNAGQIPKGSSREIFKQFREAAKKLATNRQMNDRAVDLWPHGN